MDAFTHLKDLAEVATERMRAYRIVRTHSGKASVVRLCRTGETILRTFQTPDLAEDFLLSRLPQPDRTRVD